jgi:hypothetical protein
MKTILSAALVAAGMALIPGAALAADFSGTWVRDTPQSTPSGYPVYWLTRTTQQGGGNGPVILRVTQTATTVEANDGIRPRRNYVLDGKPHAVRTDSMMARATVTSAMAGENLSVATEGPYGGMPGNVTTRETQTWTLSPDGKVLTIDLVRESPAARQTFREVYKRQ